MDFVMSGMNLYDHIGGTISQLMNNSGELAYFLDKIGRLPNNFDGTVFLQLLNHENEKVRILAVKNLGKINSSKYLIVFYKVAKTDSSTLVRREAVSSIGRLRSYEGVKLLIEFLSDNDTKIICQSIRGMLVFKGNIEIDNKLRSLLSHENEMVRQIIAKEYFCNQYIETKHTDKHSAVYSFMKNVVVNGDARDVLSLLPEESIHLTFTSPPYYNARDYSIYPSYDAYLRFLEEVFSATYRVTKEGRFLIVNTSPIIVPRISRAHSSKRYPIPFDLHGILSKMGWEFIDDIVWKKPEYSVKNRVGGFQQHRKPLAYKPNAVTEYLMVYRKPTDKLLDWNIKQYSTSVVEDSKVRGDFESTNVWEINPKSDKIHSAIFPEDLCQRVIDYYSFKGDIVFDPFAGSGTLGRTALSRGRNFFMTEVNSTYCQYIKNLLQKTDFLGAKECKYFTLENFKEILL